MGLAAQTERSLALWGIGDGRPRSTDPIGVLWVMAMLTQRFYD